MTQTLLGLSQPHRLKSDEKDDAVFIAQDYYNKDLVAFDLRGDVKFRAPVGVTMWDTKYQPEADRLCFRDGETIEVRQASTGKKLARIAPKGLDSIAELVALPDGRFAVTTRDDETNTGIINTFHPERPGEVHSAPINQIPLELTAAESGMLIAERSQEIAVVRDGQVIYQSDKVTGRRHVKADGKIFSLEASEDYYQSKDGVLVSIDEKTGAVEKLPFSGRAHNLFTNSEGKLLLQETSYDHPDQLSWRWLTPGRQPSPVQRVKGSGLDEIHNDQQGNIYLVTENFDTKEKFVYRLADGKQPEELHRVKDELWLSISLTDQGVLAFTQSGITNVSTGEDYKNLTDLVDRAGIPEIRGRQQDRDTRVKPRADDVASLFNEVTRWVDQPNPLVTNTPDGDAFGVPGGVALASIGSDLPAVVEQMLTSTAELRGQLVSQQSSTSLMGETLTFPGLPGWQLVSDGEKVTVKAPKDQTPRRQVSETKPF